MKPKFEHPRLCTSIVALSSIIFGPAPALAATNQSITRMAGIEEVVVTARRKEESAQVIPVAISALSGDNLKTHSVDSLQDLTRMVPGLRYSAEGGGQNTTISLRGLSKIPVGDGTPAVITYFADVPLSSAGTNIPTYDLSNVQVLKGPQGTLFGRNTIGGAILVTPETPSYRTEGYFKAGVGNYNNRTAEGAINIPIIEDRLAIRIAGQMRRRDGFVGNVGSGPDLDNLDQNSLRATVLFEPTDNLTNILVLDYFKADEAPSNVVLSDYKPGVLSAFGTPFSPFESSLAQAYADQQSLGIRKTNSDSPALVQHRELWGISNTTTYEFGSGLTFKNILGYRSTQVDVMGNVDGVGVLTGDSTSIPLAAFDPSLPGSLDKLTILNSGQVTNKKQFTEEVQLLGTAFDERMTWIAGASYLEDKPDGAQGSWYDQFNPYNSETGFQLNSPKASTTQTTTKSSSVFGQIGLDLSGWVLNGLTFNLGYRYTWDKISLCAAQIVGGTSSLDAPFLDLNGCEAYGDANPNSGAGSLETNSSAPTWTIGFDYQVNDRTLLYLTSRRGYRSGGINAPVFNTSGTASISQYQYIDPEQVDDIEIGLKTDFYIADVPVRINLAAYEMEYSDAIQFVNVTGYIDANDPAFPAQGSIGINAGDLTVKGVELETIVAPTEDLTLTATTAYTHQEVDSVSGIPVPYTLSKDEIALPTPEWAATLSFNWTLPVKPLDADLVFSGDYYWSDEWQVQATILPSYHVSNFRLDWTGINGNIDAGLFVTNAFEEDYITAVSVGVRNFPVKTMMYGAPRMFGLDVTYRFGQ